jgi:hypothetical protein
LPNKIARLVKELFNTARVPAPRYVQSSLTFLVPAVPVLVYLVHILPWSFHRRCSDKADNNCEGNDADEQPEQNTLQERSPSNSTERFRR